jgi:uncharacterized protein
MSEELVECPYCDETRASPQVSLPHLVLSFMGLVVLGAFTCLRRPVLLLLALVAALLGGVGPERPAFGAFGIVGFLLLAATESLLAYTPGARRLWIPLSAMAMGVMGCVFLTVHLWDRVEFPLPFGSLMLIAIPWANVASAVLLAHIKRPSSLTATSATRALLSHCRDALTDLFEEVRAGDMEKANGDGWADAMAQLKLLHGRIPAINNMEHHELRAELLVVRGHIEGGDLNTALACIHGLQVVRSRDPRRVLRGPASPELGKQGWLVRNAVTLIHAYRKIVPEHRRRSCRFHPSCSTYAETAFLQHGAFNGLRHSVNRALRCVPYGEEGDDPVPRIDEFH